MEKIFMAFSKGKETVEGGIVKRYVGVAPVFVLATNPDKKGLEEIYNTTIDNAPVYIGTNDKGVKTTRVEFIIKTDAPMSNDIEVITKAVYFLNKEYRFNRDQSKVQVIDKYGRTAWVTKEELNAHAIPMYSNGPANLDKDYRPCYVGEENLTKFIKAYLGIPEVRRYVNNQWETIPNPEEAEARLDEPTLEKMFNGDFSDLRDIINLQPKNKVKVAFGVRTTDDGKQYQTIFTEMVMKNGVRDFSKLETEIAERKNAGAYSTTVFEVCPLKEYVVEATDFNNVPTADTVDDNPWGL